MTGSCLRSVRPAFGIAARLGAFILLAGFMAGPAAAQMVDPFAGGTAPPGAPGPYGSAAGASVHILQALPAMPGPDVLGSGATASTAAGEGSEPAEGPEVEAGETIWEIFIGACAGGGFLGGYSAATAATPVVATGVAAPSAAVAVASATAIGCGLGVATAAVTLGAVNGWRSISW